jgi:hypothetical protein
MKPFNQEAPPPAESSGIENNQFSWKAQINQ